jgi:hypothetical protein
MTTGPSSAGPHCSCLAPSRTARAPARSRSRWVVRGSRPSARTTGCGCTDESTIQVTVHSAADHREFTLTEYTGPAERRIDYQIDLRPPPATEHP